MLKYLIPFLLANVATSTLQPTAGSSWNIQLDSVPSPTPAANDAHYQYWDFDLFDASASTIQAFKSKGHSVICYFSAGTWENWRPDASQFPSAALGKNVSGWSGERWLDTRNSQVRQIMANRIALAKSKGCDGVDPDNIDGYGNPTGFPLTESDGINYVQYICNNAHANGLGCGLKNGGDIVPSVVAYCDWAVVEQCVQYDECDDYKPFIQAGKPVFEIEYTESQPASSSFLQKSCNDPDAQGFSTLIKHMALNSWTENCSGYTSS